MIPESNFSIVSIEGEEMARAEFGGPSGLLGRLELGTLPRPFLHAKLPRFMVSLYFQPWARNFFIIGRLYCGYVGLMANLCGFKLTVWIHKPTPEIA